MSVANRHIAILTHDYFEQSELEIPLHGLQDAGVGVTVVSATGDITLQSMQHADHGTQFTADILLNDAKPEDYDALILPGGVINSDALRMVEPARDWVQHFDTTGKLIAAICHAPWLLVSANCVLGRTLTSYHTLQDDIRNAGGVWVDTPVTRDGNLITSRQPEDLDAFVGAIKTWLEEYDERIRDGSAV